MPSLICVGVGLAWRVFYQSSAVNLPFNGSRNGCFAEAPRGQFLVLFWVFITSPPQPHSSSPRLLPLLIINRMNWYIRYACIGCLERGDGARETAIYGSRTAFYGNIALILMIYCVDIWVIYCGEETTQCSVLYWSWRIGCGGYIFLRVDWGCIFLPVSMPSLCTTFHSHRNNLYRSQSKEVKNQYCS